MPNSTASRSIGALYAVLMVTLLGWNHYLDADTTRRQLEAEQRALEAAERQNRILHEASKVDRGEIRDDIRDLKSRVRALEKINASE